MMSSKLVGNAACFTAYLIFGFNIVFCKNMTNSGLLSPTAIFFFRLAGATALFLLASLASGRKEKVDRADFPKIAIASFFGLFMTQLSFLKAVPLCTAVDISLLSLMSPIMAMLVAAIAIKDKITAPGIIGLAISLAGVVFIVLNSVSGRSGASVTTLWGVVMMFVNTFSFSLYVGIFKPLIQKYSVITFMKWMFLLSTLYALPFSVDDILAVQYSALGPGLVAQLLFVVVFATFVSYFLIPIGQKRVKPMVVCMYTYVQPVVAMLASLAAGLDTMSWQKALATACIFVGVSIVNFTPRKKQVAG